jgi:fermentation-respiration switch protein FrsA (DUF1100 family)
MFRRALTNALLFYPERGQARSPADLGMPFEAVWLRARDGVRTQAWWIPAPGDGPVVVFFHGNAGTMSDRLENARLLRGLGVSLLMAEYRGYGDSEGKPSERGLRLDAERAVAEARQRSDGNAVVVFGRSLGGAVAIDVASRTPRGIDGLIVESTFTSLPDMARAATRMSLAARVVAYRFDSLTKIRRLEMPILIVHGEADDLVPFRMGEALRDAARRAACVQFHSVASGDHNSTWVLGGAPYLRAWREFLDLVADRVGQ